jgi:hypothetical protein
VRAAFVPLALQPAIAASQHNKDTLDTFKKQEELQTKYLIIEHIFHPKLLPAHNA